MDINDYNYYSHLFLTWLNFRYLSTWPGLFSIIFVIQLEMKKLSRSSLFFIIFIIQLEMKKLTRPSLFFIIFIIQLEMKKLTRPCLFLIIFLIQLQIEILKSFLIHKCGVIKFCMDSFILTNKNYTLTLYLT